MTLHYSEKFQIKTYTTLLNYVSKNGEQQVVIRARIINKKNKREKRIDFGVYDEFDNPIKLSKKEFKSNRYDIKLKSRIAEVNERIIFSIHHFLSHDLKLNKKKLYEFIYQDMTKVDEIKSIEYESNPIILKQLGQDKPIPKDVINELHSYNEDDFRDIDTGEQIDMDDIINNAEVNYNKKREAIELNKMNYDERYEKGLFDKNNIFDIFGYCWTINKKTGKPFISNDYKSLLIKLADYRFNKNPIEDVRFFNKKWIEDFIIFLKNDGYSSVQPHNYNPFNLNKYANDFKTKPRKMYTYSGFDKQIKFIKFYINVLQHEGLIKRSVIDTRDINTSDFLTHTVSNYTRSSHALLKSEIEKLLNLKLTGEIEITRQMFLLQTLAGGLRNDEFFNNHFKLKKINDDYYFSFYANKTKNIEENPVIDGYSDILLKQIGYKLPDFQDIEIYRKNLKILAKKANLNREIRYQHLMADRSIKVVDKPIYEIINPYWARKSFVKLGRTFGWTNEHIASYTGHSDIKTLNYYFDKLNYDDKKRITQSFKK